jgi:hypothetical protein
MSKRAKKKTYRRRCTECPTIFITHISRKITCCPKCSAERQNRLNRELESRIQARKGLRSRYVYPYRGERYKKPVVVVPESKKKEIGCLRCDEMFTSEGPWNRLCEKCVEEIDKYNESLAEGF